jgi:K+-sensing histidine kinase KdpD
VALMPNLGRSIRNRVATASVHPATRVAVVVALLMMALATTAALSGSTDTRLPYIALLPALALCCDLCGFRVALIATAACTAFTWYAFVDPVMTFEPPSLSDGVQLACFVVVTVFVCWMISLYRNEIARLQRRLPTDERR